MITKDDIKAFEQDDFSLVKRADGKLLLLSMDGIILPNQKSISYKVEGNISVTEVTLHFYNISVVAA